MAFTEFRYFQAEGPGIVAETPCIFRKLELKFKNVTYELQ